MDIRVHIYVFIVCAFGLWSLQPVTGETVDVVNILRDIREDMHNLKLANEHYERRITRLEIQVGECRTKYADLMKQTSSVTRIENRLADIEHKIESNHQELLERIKVVAKRRIVEINHSASENSEPVKEDEQNINVDAVETEFGRELLSAKERKPQANKRIIPVTSSPKPNTRIAFTAYSNPTVVQNMLAGDIPFNGVELNEGQSFDPTSHIFTCPVSGVYYFSSCASISVLGGSASKRSAAPWSPPIFLTEIVKDGSVLVKTHFNIPTNNAAFANPSTNSVVTLCNKGETVWVRFRILNISSLYLEFGGRLTTFTGFLLWEL